VLGLDSLLQSQIESSSEDVVVDINEDRMRVIIFTGQYRVTGEITLFRGARLTDYLAESRQFVAVTHAEVSDKQDRVVLTSSFLKVNLENVELILPAELSNTV
jgi:hypothetical protein